MKKSLLFLSLVFFAFSGFSQIAWDWETPETSYGIWTWGVDAPAVVYNPMMTYYNMSDSVIMVTTGESAWGWGVGGSLTEDLYLSPGDDSMFTIKILADVASPILFKFENEDNSSSVEAWADYVTPGQWQEISIYLPTPASDLTKWIFWFDPMVELGTGITFYLDDVMQGMGNVVMYNDHDNLVIPWEAFGEENFYDTVPNPLVDGINKSSLVGYTLSGPETWDGAYIYTDGLFDFTKDSVFTMDVYSEVSGTVMFKIEVPGNNSIFFEIPQEYTTPGEWVTMRYAFPDAVEDTYGVMVVFFDFGGEVVGDEWYFDNIQGPPIIKKEWGVTVNLTVVDQTGLGDMRADIWWNPGEDWNEDDPNTYLFDMELLDDDADGTWEGSIMVPWPNTVTGVFVDNQYCLFGDDEELGEDHCDIVFTQAGWDTELNLVDTIFGEPGIVEEIENGITKLYPNPVDDVLTISNTDDIVSIQVYSVVGQRVMSITNTKSGFMEINVSQLEGGVYFVNLTNRDGTITAHKIIVE